MGYEIHITRQDDCFEIRDTNKIILKDWLNIIESDPELEFDLQASASNSEGEHLLFENEGLATWKSYSKNGIEGNYVGFILIKTEVKLLLKILMKK